jgi:hypothetical protein
VSGLYLWVHELGDPADSKIHFAGEGAPRGKVLCGAADLGEPWAGEPEPSSETGGPAFHLRCGDCVTKMMVDTGRVRQRQRFIGLSVACAPGDSKAT